MCGLMQDCCKTTPDLKTRYCASTSGQTTAETAEITRKSVATFEAAGPACRGQAKLYYLPNHLPCRQQVVLPTCLWSGETKLDLPHSFTLGASLGSGDPVLLAGSCPSPERLISEQPAFVHYCVLRLLIPLSTVHCLRRSCLWN